MGIPQFFRYISQRYPCITQEIEKSTIPEFDNLYLDMNGIIHAGSHPTDDVLIYLPEETILQNIFHYTELLFRIIQPQKVFFLSVDGVAPRAKINQQRARRFRAAKLLELQKDMIKSKGLVLPDKMFDSNCITPGTAFMEMFNKAMKHFIAYKVSTDRLWQKCKIIYSGPEVPGEGEHKIMDYIRYLKSQPDYDVNTRHCLYGQDADLIMLAISTHELQFTLLREVIKYGKRESKTETKFCLLYISLLRKYIDLEFSSLKDSLPFPYDLEKIIDDWVLMGFLIGNDFIPHLPNLIAVKDALELLTSAYMKVLPTLQGYMNESGTLKLDRFEKFMETLSQMEMKQFSEQLTDIKYFQAKTGRRPDESERHVYKNTDNALQEATASPKKINKDLDALIKSTAMMSIDVPDDDDFDTCAMEFVQHKRDYYMNKLKYESVDEECLRSQAEGYVRAIQWNLHYYYNGCVNWSWYYPHHYAPYISDIKDFKDLKLEFELGEPFLPFEQLLAVLPPQSKALLPRAFQRLVTESESPVIDFYPDKFETDLNGKRQEWEAVILLPFVDKETLQTAMAPYSSELTPEERERNKHGPMSIYTYTQKNMGTCELRPYFYDIENHAHVQLVNHADIIVPREKLVKGLNPGINRDIYYLGFATFRYIQYTACLKKAKVKVFQQPSLGDNMILTLKPKPMPSFKTVAAQLLGQTIYVNWPFLIEAHVDSVSTNTRERSLINSEKTYSDENVYEKELKCSLTSRYFEKKHIIEVYKNRFGIEIGEPVILVHARPLVGRKYVLGRHKKMHLQKQWASAPVTYAYQTIVKDITVYSTPVDICKFITDVFMPETVCFMLGHPHYGAMGHVQEVDKNVKSGRIKVTMSVEPQPELDSLKKKHATTKVHYMSAHTIAQRLGISSYVLSRITGTIYVVKNTDDQQQGIIKHNIGLNLKFNARNHEVPGYTRKENGQWLYSAKAVELVSKYMVKNSLLFERLAKQNSDILYEDDIFSNGNESVESLVAWLKEQLQGIDSCPIGVETVAPEVVQEMEAILSAHASAQINSKKAVIMHVKPHLLHVPKLQLQNMPPDPNAQHLLFDRVCSVGDCFAVPLGYKGIIIGIQNEQDKINNVYDVLFDKPFLGGISLHGCTEGRGYRLSSCEFLNISYGERLEHAKTTEIATETEHRNLAKLVKTQQPNDKSFPVLRMPKESNIIIQNAEHLTSAPGGKTWKKSNPKCSKIAGSASQTKEEIVLQRTEKKTDERTMKATSKFQALWNELHEKQKSIIPQKVAIHNPTNINMNIMNKSNTEIIAQDPSDVLKAILKIPTGNEHTVQTTPREPCKTHTSNSDAKTDKEMDAPPLVKQLFDHARQNEKGKNDKSSIWYCLQLLNHYQQTGMGVPRYCYLKDKQTNLIRANILLPDGRAFVGDRSINHEQAAESAAKKVYTELNLGSIRPNTKALLPPPMQWHNNTWQQNVRPPVLVGYLPKMQPPQQYSTFNAKLPPKPQFPPPPVHENQYKPHDEQLQTGPKLQVKKSTEFVPLQAQKRNRNIMAKKEMKVASQRAKDNPTSVSEQKGESTSKRNEMKHPGNTTMKQIPVQGPSEHVKQSQPAQETQNLRPKRSRVAAKFGIQSQIDEGHTNTTVK